jgi:hypothetical protein
MKSLVKTSKMNKTSGSIPKFHRKPSKETYQKPHKYPSNQSNPNTQALIKESLFLVKSQSPNSVKKPI